ncbi:MAG: TonB-dependent receptor [Verrucomicrobia bacterium]|nr:TonB-dependent receptor [Verrucomicrobiota bacterium]
MSSAGAQTTPLAELSPNLDLLQLSLEDLGKIKVTSVSRKSESLAHAAAAIHVITQEDIRRSGVTLLPEALRMAPGLDVARASSRQWAISSRGFNSVFADKLLVLMDGRTLYTPMFSGVFWEEIDTVLEDLDRIEVIRGPGATMWGANAVNGVINFMTKHAKDTQGLLVSGGGGIEERGFGTVRYGGRLGTNADYRVYGKYSNHDEFTQTGGTGAADAWWMSQEGFRVDWEPSDINRLTLQGDYYYGDLGGKVRLHSFSPPGMFAEEFHGKAEGVNVLSRWTHEFSSESELSIQSYYDRTDRQFGIGGEMRNTFDVDWQHRFCVGDRHEFVWGGGYRYSIDDLTTSDDFGTRDPSAGLQLVSGFVQDEFSLVPERLHLMVGTKVEHNDFTGFEAQPSGRIAWTPHERHTVWGAVSRAVRTPARTQRDFMFYAEPPASLAPFPLPTLIPGWGNPDFNSEEVLAYEIGYRVQPHSRVTLDLTAFYNDYDRLYNVVTLQPELRFSPSGEPYLYLPITIDNNLFGETYGAEMTATWQPLDSWKLRASYSFLRMNLHLKTPVLPVTEGEEGGSPRNQVLVWSDVDLGRRVEWGVGLRYVDNLPGQGIPGYLELDARLAWKPSPNWELSLIGRNLLDAHHREFAPVVIGTKDVEVDRAVYAKATFRF